MVNSCRINKIFCNTWVEFTARPYFNCNHKKRISWIEICRWRIAHVGIRTTNSYSKTD